MATTLGLFKKVSLDGISDGWTDEAYLKFKPMTIKHLQQMQSKTNGVDVEKVKKGEVDDSTMSSVSSIMNVLTDMYHSGKVYNEDMELVDAESAHVEPLFMQDAERFMSALFGGATDPKSPRQSETS